MPPVAEDYCGHRQMLCSIIITTFADPVAEHESKRLRGRGSLPNTIKKVKTGN